MDAETHEQRVHSWLGDSASGDLIRSIDWGRTPLGAIEDWPRSLKTILATILHSRQPMFLWWGPELVQLYNDAYVPSFGKGKHPLAMGQRGRDCWPEIWDIIGPQIEGVMSSGQATWHEDALVPIWRNGTVEDVYWTYGYSPVFDDEGHIGGTLVICTETTGRVVATRAAEFASRAKDDFLSMASHELRTPLTGILGWSRLLRTGQLDAATSARAVETIERNATAQVRLIEDILDGSRIISGKLRLDTRALDMTPLVRAALDSLRPAADAKRIALLATLEPGAAHIAGDPDRLQQIVWNLVNNAIKFTPKGGQVDVSLRRVGTDVELVVRDNGTGIDSEFLPHVFERFRQAEGSTTRRHTGLGLGLALVRHLVEAHGGAVSAFSAGEGRGATFTVRFPVLAVLIEPATVAAQSTRFDPPGVATSPMSLAGVTVLVVDDQLDARDLVSTVLRANGAEVTCVSDVAAALELFGEHDYTVLVSDVGMPDTDGYELLRRLRTQGTPQATTPAIALTAYAREEDRRKALEAGYQCHVAKPVEPSELVRLVSELAHRKPA